MRTERDPSSFLPITKRPLATPLLQLAGWVGGDLCNQVKQNSGFALTPPHLPQVRLEAKAWSAVSVMGVSANVFSAAACHAQYLS